MQQTFPAPAPRSENRSVPALLVGEGVEAAGGRGMRMRTLIACWLMPARPANPARELALLQHQQNRDAVKAKARLMREQLGLPDHPALR